MEKNMKMSKIKKNKNKRRKKFRKTAKLIYSPIKYSETITLFENANVLSPILVLSAEEI